MRSCSIHASTVAACVERRSILGRPQKNATIVVPSSEIHLSILLKFHARNSTLQRRGESSRRSCGVCILTFTLYPTNPWLPDTLKCATFNSISKTNKETTTPPGDGPTPSALWPILVDSELSITRSNIVRSPTNHSAPSLLVKEIARKSLWSIRRHLDHYTPVNYHYTLRVCRTWQQPTEENVCQ
jgi:hypothetical protein